MPNHTAKILFVDDEPNVLRGLERTVKSSGQDIDADFEMDAKIASEKLKSGDYDLLVTDLKMPGVDGFTLIKEILEQGKPTRTILTTGFGSINIAVDAMKLGAVDVLIKPFKPERLIEALGKALVADGPSSNPVISKAPKSRPSATCTEIIGNSAAMIAVKKMIKAAAKTDAPAFIMGETGTGKELCAEAIHSNSKRQGKPFIVINCAAIPKDLLESELFGHKKGAFTGATDDRDGAVSLANGGTLFFDEIGELDYGLQSKLLRFLQSGRFMKVGSSVETQVDVRILCATNRNPIIEVQEGRFREDLFYRLFVVPIEMPPLRTRSTDILKLSEKFLNDFSLVENKSFDGMSSEVKAKLLAYSWPGNVRQLQNCIRNMVVMHEGGLLDADMLVLIKGMPDSIAKGAITDFVNQTCKPLWMIERDAIEGTISRFNGNITKAAECLEIAPSTIYRKRESWPTETTAEI